MATDLKHVSGFRQLERLLQELPQNIERRVLQAGVMAGAREIRKEVKANAPVGSGKRSPSSNKFKRLSQNIKAQPLRSAKRKGMRGARVFTGNAFWGRFLEFGTRHQAARPWFRPAVSAATGAAADKLKEGLGRGIIREAQKLARRNRVR